MAQQEFLQSLEPSVIFDYDITYTRHIDVMKACIVILVLHFKAILFSISIMPAASSRGICCSVINIGALVPRPLSMK